MCYCVCVCVTPGCILPHSTSSASQLFACFQSCYPESSLHMHPCTCICLWSVCQSSVFIQLCSHEPATVPSWSSSSTRDRQASQHSPESLSPSVPPSLPPFLRQSVSGAWETGLLAGDGRQTASAVLSRPRSRCGTGRSTHSSTQTGFAVVLAL